MALGCLPQLQVRAQGALPCARPASADVLLHPTFARCARSGPAPQTLALHQTNVKPFAVDTLLAANPDLEVQGVPPSRYARTVAPPGLLQVLQAAA